MKSWFDGEWWDEVVPNPLPWWKRLVGLVLYRSEDGKRTRVGFSTAEGQW